MYMTVSYTHLRIARADESGENSEGNARHSDRIDHRRSAGYGIYGILRRGIRFTVDN